MNNQKQLRPLNPNKKSIENLDLNNHNQIQQIISKDLTKRELIDLINKIKRYARQQRIVQNLIYLNNLLKQLKSRLSINLSKEIIQACIETAEESQKNRKELDFNNLDKQIRKTTQEIYKKKYYFKKNNTNNLSSLKKPQSAEKRRHGNLNTIKHNNTNQHNLKTFKNLLSLDQILIKQKSTILQQYMGEDELQKFQDELLYKIKSIQNQYYGKYNQRIKHYTIYDNILKKIFSLIQDDTKNVEIRNKYHKIYRKMKENMVAIIINQDDVKDNIRVVKKRKTQKDGSKNCIKPSIKKNYYQVDRQKTDLNIQIQEALQAAKRHLKEAFINRNRPDYAYQLQLQFQNRFNLSENGIKNIKL